VFPELLVLLVACGGSEPVVTDPTLVRGNLKPKAGTVLLDDLATALALPRDEVCRELGTVDCLEAHRVSLGEVAPRALRIYEPVTGLLTGVVAVERVALHACTNRVERDRTDPDALIPELASGLSRVSRRRRVVERLAMRLVRRAPTRAERDALVDLYDTLRDDGIDDLDAQWTIATCFTLATLTETLFY